MIAIKTMTAAAAGAFALATVGGAAAAQTPYSQSQSYGRAPSGAYVSSCRNVQSLDNGYMSAECRTDGGYRWSTLRYVDCRGDIANRNGVLSCSGATGQAGPFYPERDGQTQTQGPGGVLGAVITAIFGNVFVDDRQLDQDWNQGRRLSERREAVERRLDNGVRDGSLTRAEATRLQAEFDDLVRLEARYAASGGLSQTERNDLRTRYRSLAERIGEERNDGQGRDRDDDRGDRDWRSISDRESDFERRLDAAVANRTVTRSEARALGTRFDALVQLETRYSADRLTREERAELEAGYRELTTRIGGDWDNDDPRDQWRSLAERRAEFDGRVDAAVRNRTIRMTEGVRLKSDFQTLVRLETTYSSGGLTAREQEDLTTRYAALSARVGDRYDDGQTGGGYGNGGSSSAAAIEARIVAGERSGAINRTEAAGLRTELGDLTRLEASYASDGLNAAERDYVSRRYAELSARIATR